MIKPGKKTREWYNARLQLKKQFQDWGITTCEIRLEGCRNNWSLGFAHTRKRRYVTDLKRVVLACNECHYKVEYYCDKYTGMDMENYLEKIISERTTF